jgi:CHAT domain
MSTYEFKVLIDDEGVKGEYGLPSKQPELAGHAELHLDQLTLKTVALMNRWLSYWDLIEHSGIRRKESLLDSNTLEVLGTQLWRLILDNDVGNALRKKIPQQGKPALRLSIAFKDEADARLKELPWEFLFEPESQSFLATQTELLLTRYVSTAGDRVKVSEIGDKEEVRALLIAALPDDNRFAAPLRELEKLGLALQDVTNLTVPKPIDVWDPVKVSEMLAADPYHIIHVVGICKGAPGKPKIYLGGGEDGFQDPRQFVDILTVNPKQLRLVILHLCDFVDGDATENFERLAPALIERQVPAVLALQYAYEARVTKPDYTGLGKTFYESLVNGEQIGAAVQASRRRLRAEGPDRRFGTPVLYLQEDGALRRRPQAGGAKPTARPRSSGGPTIQSVLFDVVMSLNLGDEATRKFLGWVLDLDQSVSLTDAQNRLREWMLLPLDATSKKVLIEMMTALGRLEQERSHGKS